MDLNAGCAAMARGLLQVCDPMNVLITTPVPDEKTAWTKGRMDVMQILRQEGYAVVQLPAGASPTEWFRLASSLNAKLGKDDHILIEYPMPQRKRTYFLYLFSLLRRVKLYALIHDLNSIRYDSPQGREVAILRLFDGLISHNPSMTRWLRDGGLSNKIVELQLFDYCTGAAEVWHEGDISLPLQIVCASNLSYDKARYIYDPQLGQLPNVELSLYGAYFEPERMPATPMQYMGAFDPDTPFLNGRYHFGLIWDGTGVERCEGSYGQYMRFNSPHKLSLYAALGMPVIVWREAAVADFVLKQGIGVTVANLLELGDIFTKVSTESYRQMAQNMVALSCKVKRGEILRDALRQLAL
jgi:hypothetical protein